jgi:predicted secreted protein
MSPLDVVLTYAIMFCIVLFMVLPFGARPPESPAIGHATSAPARPRIGLKLAIAAGIAALLTGVAYVVLAFGWLTLR